MSATIIRPVAKQDESAWRQLWAGYNDFYHRTISEEVTATTFSRFLDPDVQMFCSVAVDSSSSASSAPSPDGKIIGFVTWFPHMSTSSIKPVVYLNDLFVDPAIRTKGTGGQLIDHVYEHSKDVLGVEKVYWHTQHFNHAAQLLYVKKAAKTDFVQYAKQL